MKFRLVLRAFLACMLAISGTGCDNKQKTGPGKDTANARPEVIASQNTAEEAMKTGLRVYTRNCLACHQSNGSGVPGMYPPVANNTNLQGDPLPLIQIILKGKSGKVVVNGKSYSGIMASHAYLTDTEVAAVLTYIRGSMGNAYPPVEAGAVAPLR